MSKSQTITRPEQVASELGISGKVVRAYLRRTFTRPIEAKNTSWSLSANEVAQTLKHFRALNDRKSEQANA